MIGGICTAGSLTWSSPITGLRLGGVVCLESGEPFITLCIAHGMNIPAIVPLVGPPRLSAFLLMKFVGYWKRMMVLRILLSEDQSFCKKRIVADVSKMFPMRSCLFFVLPAFSCLALRASSTTLAGYLLQGSLTSTIWE